MTSFMMNHEHATTALDRGVQGVLGKPLDRIDGPAKVTGAATYAIEHDVPGLAYGYPIVAQAGAGRVTRIDTAAALELPDVIAVFAGDDELPRQTPLWGDDVQHYDGTLDSYGEIVGLAVATSFEAARAAARAVVVETEAGERLTDMHTVDATPAPKTSMLPDTVKGDLDKAMADAPITTDVHYTTPRHVHAAMEPHGAIAEWRDGKLTVHGQFQLLGTAIPMLADALGIEAEDIRLLTPFLGGGFGGKVMTADAVLAAVAAKRIGRPVKVALARRQIFHACYGRSNTDQRLRLAAERDGTLIGIGQDSLVAQKIGGSGFEPVALGALGLYAGKHRSFTTRIAKLNLTAHGPVRAPGEAVGMMGLECAMDELAVALDIDPIDLRRRNEPEKDPTSGLPFSSRRLLDCFDEGAERFGWERHPPSSRRRGEWLIGTGVATAARVNFLMQSKARVRLEADGSATIETDMTDIGTGSYTILAQIAGEALGVPVDRIAVNLGDSRNPTSAGSGGSFGAASSASSVVLACEDIVAELARRMDADPQDLTLQDGHATAGNRRIPVTELLGDAALEGEGAIMPGTNNKTFSQAAHGAQFAEVWVNAVTGEARVKRMLGVFDCGRILNHKTARSQAIGGMIWGLGYALLEEAQVDPRSGQYANGDLGEYLIATNADVPQVEAYFVEEIDRHANPVGAKGLGELGISGAGAAVANAVYNACGVRVRDFPITCDKLLAGLPAL